MKLLVSLVVAFSIASQTFAGMTITSVMKSESAGKGGDKPASMRLKVEDANARMEWIEGRDSSAPTKGYLVTRDAGKTLYMVNPDDKTYMKWDVAAMAQMAAGLVNMKVKDYKVEKVLDEDGPTILGYPTRHYKFVTSYSMEMAMFGMKKTTTGKNEQELWTTTKINPSALAVFEKMAVRPTAGFGDLQKVIEAEKTKSVKGFPLKTVTTMDSGTPERPKITKSIMEITELKEGRIAVSEFEMPKDYKEVTMGGDAAEANAGGEEGKEGNRSPKSDDKAPAGLDAFFKKLAPKR
jgi:hypothetical protein